MTKLFFVISGLYEWERTLKTFKENKTSFRHMKMCNVSWHRKIINCRIWHLYKKYDTRFACPMSLIMCDWEIFQNISHHDIRDDFRNGPHEKVFISPLYEKFLPRICSTTIELPFNIIKLQHHRFARAISALLRNVRSHLTSYRFPFQ